MRGKSEDMESFFKKDDILYIYNIPWKSKSAEICHNFLKFLRVEGGSRKG